MKILIIDDAADQRMLYKEELGDEGYDIVLAANGREALDKISDELPNLIVLDMQMPVMDGLETLVKIKGKEKNIPVIIHSAYSSYKDDFVHGAADAFLVKSADLTALKRTIKELISKKNVEKATEVRKFEKPPLDDIIKRIEKINIRSIDIINYGNKIKTRINSLKKNLDSSIMLINSLLKNRKNKKVFDVLRDVKKSVEYSKIFAESISNIFLETKPISSQININKLIDEVLDILSYEITYETKREYRFKDGLETDENLLRQIIFVLIKNINDYFYDNKGYLAIATEKREQEYENKQKQCMIKFQFGVSKRITDSKDEKKVLIVDDEKNIKLLLNDAFTEVGYNVFFASDGYECLDLLFDESFNLIILDMQMIGIESLEVLETLRRNRRNKHIPVIIYSVLEYVTKTEFMEKIAVFDPVETLMKTANTDEIINLSNELVKKRYRTFSFEDIYNLDLESSIKQDHVLGMGLFSLRKCINMINGNINFLDTNNSEQCIVLKLPSLLPDQSKFTTVQSAKDKKRIEVQIDYLNKMNDNFRHDLKNKLRAVKYGLGNISSSRISTIRKNIDESIKLLDEIKDIQIK